mgnify:FL=1
MNSLLYEILSALDLSKRTAKRPANKGLASIVLILLKGKIPEDKTQMRISKHRRREMTLGLIPSKKSQIFQ